MAPSWPRWFIRFWLMRSLFPRCHRHGARYGRRARDPLTTGAGRAVAGDGMADAGFGSLVAGGGEIGQNHFSETSLVVESWLPVDLRLIELQTS